MDIDVKGIVIVVGNYGSGKTEVSINLAAHQKRTGDEVRIADLDLVNPYFRTREARGPLSQMGIDVVLPPVQYMQADLPILDPAVAGMLRRPRGLTLLDVGGDDAGATVLAALADVLVGREMEMLQVINPYRPYTETVAGCLMMRRAIESAAKLTVTGLVGNANLIDETTVDHIYDGYDFVSRVAQKMQLPLRFVTAMEAIHRQIDPERIGCPVLPMKRLLVPPWQRAAQLIP